MSFFASVFINNRFDGAMKAYSIEQFFVDRKFLIDLETLLPFFDMTSFSFIEHRIIQIWLLRRTYSEPAPEVRSKINS